MNINDLIAKLQKIRDEKGDLEVFIKNVYGADIGIAFRKDIRKYFDEII